MSLTVLMNHSSTLKLLSWKPLAHTQHRYALLPKCVQRPSDAKKREGGKRLQFNFVRYIVQKKVSRGDVKIFLTHLASHIDKRPNSFTSTTDHYGSVAIFVFILTHSILHKNPELVNRRFPMSRQKELSRMWFEYVERCRFGKSSSGLLGIRKK